MKRLRQSLQRPLLLAVLLAFAVQAQAAGVLIVANTAERDLKLTRIEVRNLFMGEASDLALDAIALPPDNLTRVLFNTKVMGLAESRIQAYWAQIASADASARPGSLKMRRQLRYVLANEGAVGRFSQDTPLPEGLSFCAAAIEGGVVMPALRE